MRASILPRISSRRFSLAGLPSRSGSTRGGCGPATAATRRRWDREGRCCHVPRAARSRAGRVPAAAAAAGAAAVGRHVATSCCEGAAAIRAALDWAAIRELDGSLQPARGGAAPCAQTLPLQARSQGPSERTIDRRLRFVDRGAARAAPWVGQASGRARVSVSAAPAQHPRRRSPPASAEGKVYTNLHMAASGQRTLAGLRGGRRSAVRSAAHRRRRRRLPLLPRPAVTSRTCAASRPWTWPPRRASPAAPAPAAWRSGTASRSGGGAWRAWWGRGLGAGGGRKGGPGGMER